MVKMCDFEFARDIRDKNYYKSDDVSRPVPIRWMSIESIVSRKFTLESDVVCILQLLVI